MTTWTVEKKETRLGRLYVGQKIEIRRVVHENLVVTFASPAMAILTNEYSNKTYILRVSKGLEPMVSVEEYNFAMVKDGVHDVEADYYTQWNSITVKDDELVMMRDFETKESVRVGTELRSKSNNVHVVGFIGSDAHVITTSREQTFAWSPVEFVNVFRGVKKDD